MFSDYNCRIFDTCKFESLKNDGADVSLLPEFENIKKDIEAMTRIGFHTFYCPIRYNDSISVTQTQRSLLKLKKYFQKVIPRNCGKISVNFVPQLYLSSDAPYIKNISALAIKNSNRVFVELPLELNPDYIPETLNKLLFSCRLLPIFLEFQLFVAIYDPTEIEKMLRINGAAFQFNIRSAFEPQNVKIIKKILSNGNTVLLGTNCKHDFLNVKEINRSIEKLKKAVGEEMFLKIILNSKKFLS